MLEFKETISKFYIGYFNRAGETEGMEYWIGRLQNGTSLQEIANYFARAGETKQTYKSLENVSDLANADFVKEVYTNLFGRAPDPAGQEFWLTQLKSGENIGKTIVDIIMNAEGNDAEVVANKAAVATEWFDMATQNPELDLDAKVKEVSGKLLKNVTGEKSSVNNAVKRIEDGDFPTADTSDANTPFTPPAPTPPTTSPAPTPPAPTPPAANEGPTAVSVVLDNLSYDENTTPGRVGTITVTDDGQGTNALTLTGADAAFFEIKNLNEIHYKGASLDFETKDAYSFAVQAVDNSTSDAAVLSSTQTIAVNDLVETGANAGPTAVSITLDSTSITENTTPGKVGTVSVSDDGNGTNTLTLIGRDSSLFEIKNTNEIHYKGPSLNHEAKPNLKFSVEAVDNTTSDAAVTSGTSTISVDDVNEAPSGIDDTNSLKTDIFMIGPFTTGNEYLAKYNINAIDADSMRFAIQPGSAGKMQQFEMNSDGVLEGFNVALKNVRSAAGWEVATTSATNADGNQIDVSLAGDTITGTYTASGAGPTNFTVATTTTAVDNVYVNTFDDGTFLVSWRSNDQTFADKTGGGAYGRLYNSDGTEKQAVRIFQENDRELIDFRDLLANDTDPEQTVAELDITSVDGTSALGATLSLRDTDADGNVDAIRYDLGDVASLNLGTITQDTFTYTVSDPDGLTSTATVTIDVMGIV